MDAPPLVPSSSEAGPFEVWPSSGFPSSAASRPRRAGASSRWVVSIFSLGVIVYSFAVLGCVAMMGDLGIRCVFGRVIRDNESPSYFEWRRGAGEVEGGFAWSAEPPQVGDTLLQVGAQPIEHYTDYVEVLRQLRTMVHQWVPVRWETPEGARLQALALVKYRPLATYLWSLIWFAQEMVIFAIGARVYWRRPQDESARLFFWLCIVTVGAYMGGYHWSEIVVDPWLIFLFAAFALFVPMVSLHFYLVFPRPNAYFVKHRRGVLRGLYALPTVYLGALWASMAWARYTRHGGGPVLERALALVKYLALGYIPLALATFLLCIFCLEVSFRSAKTQAERNQVRWIKWASWLALPFILYLLGQTVIDPATLGLDRSAWPMFVVSLLYTLAYAMSITRYRLMQAEEIYRRSKDYVLVSGAAALLYWALVLGMVVIGANLAELQVSRREILFALTALVLLGVLGTVRGRVQRAIDRRFLHEKSKFDRAMRRMSLAVDSMVDRATLARRLLEAAAEVLSLEWGVIYLAQGAGPRGPLHLAACSGPEPDQQALGGDNPLVERLRRAPMVRLPQATAPASSDPATDAMIALGGEVAYALTDFEPRPHPERDGHPTLAGLLVLGPRRSGRPYDEEEVQFLGALASVGSLALHSAGIQQTLESLNRELRGKVEKIAEQQRRILILQDQLTADRAGDGDHAAPAAPPESPAAPGVFDAIKGASRAVQQVLAEARKVAASPSAVLIRGESGTGKELLAEAIHAASPRASRPFVQVHCAALSQSLLESELFGHVKGAFTGADRDRVGRFEQADGGTLFLDEIGDINLEVQTKLLRVLQEMTFERVGSSQPITVDVRIIAATNQDLEALIRQGRFRDDLYYRLNVIPIRTPALRERKDDIFELAVHFLRQHAKRIGKGVTYLEEETIEALLAYDWPGNIRELENAIERAVVMAEGPALTPADLPPQLRAPGVEGGPGPARRGRLRWSAPLGSPTARPAGARVAGWDGGPSATGPGAEPAGDIDQEIEAFERRRLLDALAEAHQNKSEAARLLGMPRSTFFSKLKKHGLA